jgi:hypothetical protein
MRFIAVKDLGDSLPLLRSQRCHIDQRFDALVIRCRNHCTGISVSCDNHRTVCPGDRPVQCDDIVAERGEWERRGNDLQSLFVEKENDFVPTRSIRPSTMGNNHRAIFREWHVSFLCSDPVLQV